MSHAVSLKIFHNGQLVDSKTLQQEVIKIGKLRSSHLCLEDERVARMHAVIESSGSEVRVIDLGSSGGTFLNGERVEKNASVADGDALDFGPYRVEVGLLESAGLAAAGFGAAMPADPMGATVARRASGAAVPAIDPTPAAPVRVAPQSTPLHVDTSDVERQDGTHVAEVVTCYRATVLDAQHVGQVKSRRKAAPLFLGAAAALMLGGGALLASEVSQDWEAYGAAKTAAIESGAELPATPGLGLGGLGMGLMLLGLVPMGLGVVRLSDTGVSRYRIGEGHDVEFNTGREGLPTESFELVGGSDAGRVLNFTPAMSGEVSVGGESITLSALADSGVAASNGQSYAYALPAGARCKVRHGELTYFINDVAAGKQLAGKSEADKPFWAYNGASLAAVGSLLVMTHLIPDDAMAMNMDTADEMSRFVGYMAQPDEQEEEEVIEQDVADDQDAGGSGQRDAGDEGSMGDQRSKARNKRYAMKGKATAIPQMSRSFDPDMKIREAGILGQLQKESGHFLASPHGAAFAIGQDDEDVWGNMTGTEIGTAFGNGGHGLVGTGRGGGGNGEGTIGMGNFGLIGHGGNGGDGSGYGPGSGHGRTTAFKGKPKRVPRVRAAKVTDISGMDKSIIRRIVRNHFNEVRHCYNQGLAKNPNLKGRVAIQFRIATTGKVVASVATSNTTGDQSTGHCIAKAVKRWKFPRPDRGGMAMVTYPFILNPG